MSSVTVENITFSYGGPALALDLVDLTISPGEIVAVLGPNGSGKTTLVGHVLGLHRPDTGSVRVLGVDPVRAWSTIAHRVRYVPQATNFEPVLTVSETLRWMAGYYAASVEDVERAMKDVELWEMKDRRIGRLSGGQQRRVDLATSILGEPELLVLDEPSANLDVEFRSAVHALIRGVCERGVAILLTTHDLAEAAELADRVTLLGEGRVLAHGPVGEVVASTGLSTSVTFEVKGASVVVVEFDGVRHEFEARSAAHQAAVSDGSKFTRSLLEAADRYGCEIAELEVSRPKLEDAYLQATRRPSSGKGSERP